jgi:hypothetical protein
MKDNYELVYDNLLKKLEDIDLHERIILVGGFEEDHDLSIHFLNRPIRVSEQGIRGLHGDEPDVSTRIILCHYLLQAGEGEVSGEWVSYRDFKDSGFFIRNFQANVEERIARYFGGRPGDLDRACRRLHGKNGPDRRGGETSYTFAALPRIPLLLVFYDQDDEFPAAAKLLFDRSAPLWLDMECLAALGGIVADRLIKAADGIKP